MSVPPFFSLIRRLFFVAAIFSACAPGAFAIIDLDGNGQSDIWALIYNAQGLPASGDADGDGVSNLNESLAGTNPLDGNSRFAVSTTNVSGTNVTLTWLSVRGKHYQVQIAPAPDGSWTNAGTALIGNGLNLTTSLDPGTVSFYRVVVSDVDSDGDGLSDAEELALGLNPNLTDSRGNGVTDYDFVAAALGAQNVVSIRATNVFVSEQSTTPGTFTITRSGNLNALTVNYTVSGTATPGQDYVPLSGSVRLGVGVNSATVLVTPVPDTAIEGGESVIVTLTVPPGSSPTTYALDRFASATVVINDQLTPSGTGLLGLYYDNESSNYTNAANFTGLKVTRIDPTIDFLWHTGTPYTGIVNVDNFSGQWLGELAPSTTGAYAFDLQADDGARLYVNNVLVIDGWAAGSSTAVPLVSAPITLTKPVPQDSAHRVPIRVEYYENTDIASVHLRWKPPGTTTFVSLPKANVFQPGSVATSGDGWNASYYNNTTLSGAPVKTATGETAVYYDWYAGTPDPSIGPDTFTIRWTGQVQPEFSEEYTFVVRSDEGAKLWVNGQLIIDKWGLQSVTDQSGKITLQAGERYDIKLEYAENTYRAEVHLSWYSLSQSTQIIPSERLYPTGAPAAPVLITSPTEASAVLGGPFSFGITAGTGLTTFVLSTPGGGPPDANGNTLPPGLVFDPVTGLITGVPTVPGDYQITIRATKNGVTGTTVLTIHVEDTGSRITRDVWNTVTGTGVSFIPVETSPDSTSQLSSLQEIADSSTAYGTRIRGYITAPVTGNYYFWIAGSNTAELWISNDSEPVSKVRRASVVSGTAALEWTKEANQKSPWLALVAGQKYYAEILHNTGDGAHNLAVGWLKPAQAGTAPSEVVPGYVLSPYVEPPAASNPGTLYVSTMVAQGVAQTRGVGNATLRLSADETQAILTRTYANLSGPLTGEHIHADPYKSQPSQIIFDIDQTPLQPDGTYIWSIAPVGTLSAADIVDIIKQGAAYINLHTAAYPSGEIRGNFTLAEGSRKFTRPPAPPVFTDDHGDANAASRFLTQATFGPSQADIAALQAMPSYEAWIDNQTVPTLPVTAFLPAMLSNVGTDPTNPYSGPLLFNTWWQTTISAPDQLRQRVAFALSETLVVSNAGPLNDNGLALSFFYDRLLTNAFGNARNLLKDVTLSPGMGRYLDMLGNDKPDLASGRHPNENYAREIMQLFSIGLYRMWPDGSLMLTSKDVPVPTYDQNTIIGMARVFTGWTYNQPNSGSYLPTNFAPSADWVTPMKEVPSHHFTGQKTILDHVVLPGLPTVAGQPLDPYAAHTTSQIQDPSYQALPSVELGAAHDALFNHANAGPFLCRQLIQRLVTSNPSPAYVYRVVQKFNDNGAGVRGDMKAVIKAILLDYEARSSALVGEPRFGKQREPLLRVTAAVRAFPAPPPLTGTYDQNGSRTITVTTPSAHRLANNSIVPLQFTSGAPAPTTASYTTSVTGANTFTINADGLLAGTYAQSAQTITVTCTSHGLSAGNPVYLDFTSGGAGNKQYVVATVPTSSTFTVTASDSASRSGNVLLAFSAKGGGYIQTGTAITVSTPSNHYLSASDSVYIDFASGTNPDGVYQVASVLDEDHFTVTALTSKTQSDNSIAIASLSPPPITRSGNVTIKGSTWNMGSTDTDLAQTPLSSTTVFNFFFPDFRFPGALASAGLTTPEFQLTSDTNVMRQTNLLTNGILYPTGNTTGLSSFKQGSDALVMDLGPWMSKTADASIPALADELGTLLTGGQIPAAMKTIIVNYITGPPTGTKNFPMTSPTPTETQKRDRVRAIVQLLVTSPDFTIQR